MNVWIDRWMNDLMSGQARKEWINKNKSNILKHCGMKKFGYVVAFLTLAPYLGQKFCPPGTSF